MISERRLAGCPTWRVGSYFAPRIESLAFRDDDGEPFLLPLLERTSSRQYFRPRVWLYLESESARAYDLLRPDDIAELRTLRAAVARDIWGCSYDEVGAHVGWQNERTVRAGVKRGRRLWQRLPAWPWSWWEVENNVVIEPADWRSAGAEPNVAAGLATWATGSPILP